MDIIFKRRSIRKYESKLISEDKIKKIIQAGMCAPSAGDERPWHFIVINKREVLDKIPSVHPYSNMIKEAPLAILICGDLNLEKHTGFWIEDCSAATENVLLAATSFGLGSIWLGVYPREDRVNGLKKLFDINDEKIIPFSLIPIGYPAEIKSPKDIYDKDRIHFNKW
jgi:nitroreductase